MKYIYEEYISLCICTTFSLLHCCWTPGGSHSLTILDRAAVNMGVQVSLGYVGLESSGEAPKRGTAGSYGRSSFRLLIY